MKYTCVVAANFVLIAVFPRESLAYSSECSDFTSRGLGVSVAHLVYWTPSEAMTYEAVAGRSVFDGGPNYYYDLFFEDWLTNVSSGTGHGFPAPYAGPSNLLVRGESMLYFANPFTYVTDDCIYVYPF